MKAVNDGLTAEQLRARLDYDPSTGAFVWRDGAKRGVRAGTLKAEGYRFIWIGGKQRLAHRLAWLYAYGEWPQKIIDHRNREKDDNRIVNLRQAGDSENQYNRGAPRNNTSGVKGVCWNEKHQRWQASITVNGRRRCLGAAFPTRDAAANAYAKAAAEFHGEFADVERVMVAAIG